jgi:hypothetical protein
MSEALLKLLAERQAASSRARTIKPESGRNRYRILPSPKGADAAFWADFGQHFIKDATGAVKAVYICTTKTFGRPCQICQSIEAASMNTTDDLTLKRLSEAQATPRVLLNVLHLDGPRPTEPQVLEIAPTVFNGRNGVGGIVSLFKEWPNLIDLEKGTDIIIEKSGSGRDTSYGVQVAGGSKPVNPEVMKKVMDLDVFVAQENEQAKQRALTSVAAITGYLPPPAATPRSIAAPKTPEKVVNDEEWKPEEKTVEAEPSIAELVDDPELAELLSSIK